MSTDIFENEEFQ